MTTTPDVLRPSAAALAGCPPIAGLLETGSGRRTVGGLWSSAAAFVVGLSVPGRGRVVAIAPTAESAESLVLDLTTLFPDLDVAHLPVEEADVFGGPEGRANRSERLVALASLADPGDGVLVVPGPVLLEELPAPEGPQLTVAKGGTLDRERLLTELTDAGFSPVPLVAAPGEVSVRGDIIDVYPWAAESPVRIELFDDEVEEVRRFEVENQRSVEILQETTLHLGSGDGDGVRFVDVVDLATTVHVVDPPRLKDRLAEVAFERKLPPQFIDATLERLRERPGGELFALDTGDAAADVSLHSVGNDPRPLQDVVKGWRGEGRSIVVLCDGDGERDRLAASLTEDGLLPADDLHLASGRLTAGFALPAPGPVVAHHHELIGRRATRRQRPRRMVATRALDSLAELNPGDWVVHLLHGVARFRGMKRLARDQGEEDFLSLEFANDTKLFVPASRIDLVERFIGGDAKGPKLDKIGGKTWGRKKDRVRRAVKDLAAELLDLQARRQGGEGHVYPADDPMLARFEATFPYEDTPDQHQAWVDARSDMGKGRVMDRLLVGDVGFGKTEIAVRAAYLSVLGGRQVAVLVPTTILAEQHHETFRHRMAEEPVRIEVLSRLRRSADITAALKDLASGQVDIVIGTHKLLGKAVKFANLGLVIVDEEQRFGVVHKERLKQLRASVDVLTLSATPIPRTLHMAMSGLRDISTIHTPPPGRRPVATRVTYESDETIRAALRHELDRGGQVFVLHNRVQSIDRMLERIRRLVPTARCDLAHGQMAPRELADIVERFAQGNIDVLVCTTIIESGIDIPRANTIVVTDSHHFGLADMHQLRGRVGRENRQAYAFFLVPQGKITENGERRLKAIEEFSSLDAGLPIALRDLELRGAGNLLGAEQSGHILSVGYDMYCRLLQSAVAQAKGKPADKEPGEIEVDIGQTAYLPVEYVPDESMRMGLLRRLAHAGKKKLEAIEVELVDRFGALPEPARQLIELFRLRRLVRLAGIATLASDGTGSMILTLRDAKAFERSHPFQPHELYPFTPTQIRVPWPDDKQTPAARLRYLLDKFSTRRRTVSTGT